MPRAERQPKTEPQIADLEQRRAPKPSVDSPLGRYLSREIDKRTMYSQLNEKRNKIGLTPMEEFKS